MDKVLRKITIQDQINTDYRKYALYVIQSRGIPNFYDGLTPVQRLIVEYSPTSFNKTLSVVGAVFQTGLYRHGDASLSQAISKIARPFGCAEQILEGDGFFGSPVNPTPSAPRYTSVRISKKYKEVISEHKDLNIENEEGGFDWIHVTYPLGLSTHVVGIAVGYRSNILPRKYDEVIAYLEGDKTKKLKPYFKDFNGKISKVENASLKAAWLIEGEFSEDVSTKTIKIESLSPLMRYDSFVDRIHKILGSQELDYKIDNRSKSEISLSIKVRCSTEQFEEISKSIKKETQQIVTENIVIVKDGSVVEYETIQDYLDEFSVHREEVLYKRVVRNSEYNDTELLYQEAKLKFLIFMSQKRRENEEIIEFLKQFDKKISSRLESIVLIKLSSNEIVITKEKIEELKKLVREFKKLIVDQLKKWTVSKKVWNSKAQHKGYKRSSLLMDAPDTHINGIQVWNPEDAITEVTIVDTEEETEELETN